MPAETTLKFLKPGILTLVQDYGRTGHQHYGVPFTGVMDRRSARIANLLVGRSPDDPLIEITLLGPKIEFSNDCMIAIAGADLSATLNNAPMPVARTTHVLSGDILSFGRPVKGCRTYLAVNGSPRITNWLGSASAIRSLPGFMEHSEIKKGDQLVISGLQECSEKYSVNGTLERITSPAIIRVLAGPEYQRFNNDQKDAFFDQPHTISKDANRMGYRLTERLKLDEVSCEIISSGIIPGTIQVTPSGQPIILLADAQTTGGYARIANVISADLDILAQLPPGSSFYLQVVSLDEAREILAEMPHDEIHVCH